LARQHGFWFYPPRRWPSGSRITWKRSGTRATSPIAQAKTCAALYVGDNDYPGVVRAVADLQADIARVTACTPAVTHAQQALGTDIIVAGSLGKSALITRLIREGKIDARAIVGRWESFLIEAGPSLFPAWRARW
jgi:hypothetical protein